jgi:hypothetical protein
LRGRNRKGKNTLMRRPGKRQRREDRKKRIKREPRKRPSSEKKLPN